MPKNMKAMFSESANELKKIPVLAICAMFAALSIVLNSVTIVLGPYLKIGFSGLPNQLVDLLFGPITGALFGGILDIVKYFMNPTGPYFFGFTFSAMLAAFIYGFFYYKKPLTFTRVLIAHGIVCLVVNVILGTLWLKIMYGKAFFVLLPTRALKNLIMWPVDSIIFYTLTGVIERTGVLRMFRTNIVKLKRA